MSDAKRMEKGLYIEERGRAVKDRGQGRLDLDRWLSAVGFENKELPPARFVSFFFFFFFFGVSSFWGTQPTLFFFLFCFWQ